MAKLKRNVVLVGMMGAGKTAIGKALAARLGVPFRDSDQALEEAANMTIPEIFARDGEAFFREKEAQIIARLMELDPGILSTGGGAFLRAGTRDVIAERGVALWLKADLEVLWQRVKHKDTRPLLRTPDPRATLAELLAQRSPHYAKAPLRVEAEASYSIEDTTEAVVTALAARPDVLEVSHAQ
ncbi:MAG: shikimate kinase [Pseudomonadota bacterium]